MNNVESDHFTAALVLQPYPFHSKIAAYSAVSINKNSAVVIMGGYDTSTGATTDVVAIFARVDDAIAYES